MRSHGASRHPQAAGELSVHAGLALRAHERRPTPFQSFRAPGRVPGTVRGPFRGHPRGRLGELTDVAFRAWNLPLAAARQSAKELRAKIAIGHDVAGEKQERKSTALARIGALPNVRLTAR